MKNKSIITLILCVVLVIFSGMNSNNYVSAAEETSLSGQAHVQTFGDKAGSYKDGILTLGTTGQSKRLESIIINLENNTGYEGSIQYRVHRQTYGWTEWVNACKPAGTTGQGKRLEGIQIRLTGELANHYSVKYRVHIQSYGWNQGWQYDGALAGTEGEAKRLESLEVQLVPKTEDMGLIYRVHRQTYGWEMPYKSNGTVSGTTGQSKRLEGIEIALTGNKYSGSIIYSTHVQSYGWMNEVSDGMMSGTSGKAKRLESIKIRLDGEVANHYDVYYRVHAQSYGWLGWAKNGAPSGTAGYGKRLEAIQILLVEKNKGFDDKMGGIVSVTEASYIDKNKTEGCSHSWVDVIETVHHEGKGHVETERVLYDGKGKKYYFVDVDESESGVNQQIFDENGQHIANNLSVGQIYDKGSVYLTTVVDEHGQKINQYSTGDTYLLDIGDVPESTCEDCLGHNDENYVVNCRYDDEKDISYHLWTYHGGGANSNVRSRNFYMQVKELEQKVYVEDEKSWDEKVVVRQECSLCGSVKNVIAQECAHNWLPQTQTLYFEEMGHYQEKYYYEDGTLCTRLIAYDAKLNGENGYYDNCYALDGIKIRCLICNKDYYDYREEPNYKEHFDTMHGGNIGVEIDGYTRIAYDITPVFTKVKREITYVQEMIAHSESDIYMYTCSYCGATKGK